MLFGHEATPAHLEVLPRSTRWRLRRSLQYGGGLLALAPFVALLPPHAPWALGALAGAGFVARRQWTHRFTVTHLEGPCPRCGDDLTLPGGTRLRRPHPVSCEGCGHEASLEVEEADLPGG